MQGQETRYEVIAESPDGRKALVCYTPGPSRSRLMKIVHERALPLLRYMGADDETTFRWRGKAAAGLILSNGWIVRFSGRTQREAIAEGDHEFIGT